MTVLLALAWRNVWRNRRRSLITIAALSLGTAGIIGLHSYRESTYGELVRSITAGLLGHLQVHGRGYQESPDVSTVVADPMTVEARVASALPGARTERRVLGAALAGAGSNSSAALVLGLQWNGAPSLATVVSGRAVAGAGRREAVVGKDLARDLGLTVGQELVLLGQAADGSTANDKFSVVGTAASGTAEMDATAVFLDVADAQEFFALGTGVNQLIVRLPEAGEDLSGEASALRGALDLATLEALSWTEMLPELRATMEQKRQRQHMVDAIVFLIVALGVLNAVTMSTFERTRELGVLAALGTRPSRVLALILSEAALQGVLGFLIGLVVATAFIFAVGTIDLSAFQQADMMGVRLPSLVVLRVSFVAVQSAFVTALATVLAGSLAPALRAARLPPVEAMRHT